MLKNIILNCSSLIIKLQKIEVKLIMVRMRFLNNFAECSPVSFDNLYVSRGEFFLSYAR